MLLIDGHWYELPDGTRVRASKVGGSPSWYLLVDDRDVAAAPLGDALVEVVAGDVEAIGERGAAVFQASSV